MSKDAPQPLIVVNRIDAAALEDRVAYFFETMVKFVVDIERERIALGADLHADLEALLLEDGSRSEDLWGANYHPGQGAEACLEFTSLINIRPSLGNPGMEVADTQLRERIREITFRLIGAGESL